MGILGVFVLAFVAGRRLEEPVQMPTPQTADLIKKQETAEAQFAIALLHPTQIAAWKKVISDFNDSPLADLARLRLGVALMSGAVPDTQQALEQFRKTEDASGLGPEKSHLKLLGLIGQLWVLQQRPRTDETDRITSEIQAIVDGYEDTDELDIALGKGPQELKTVFERASFVTSQNSPFNFGSPSPRGTQFAPQFP